VPDRNHKNDHLFADDLEYDADFLLANNQRPKSGQISA